MADGRTYVQRRMAGGVNAWRRPVLAWIAATHPRSAIPNAPRESAAVSGAYSAASEAAHPIPVRRIFAKSLGCPADELEALPAVTVDAFTGVSNVSLFADSQPEMRVLDLGCGAGLDSLIAA